MRERTAADIPTGRPRPMYPAPYGMELIIDLHDCDPTMFTREHLHDFFVELCQLLGMRRADLHFWDYDGFEDLKIAAPPHLRGTSAVQFISTSNITVHTLDDLRRVYINIFSCREFKVFDALAHTVEFFGAGWCGHRVHERS